MKYVIYFHSVDGTNDSVNVDNSKERDSYLKTAKVFDYITDIAYASIYKSGEYGKRMLVKGKLLNTI